MRLFKLHGLGNDFLVLLDDGSWGPVSAGHAAALCRRDTGVGADGLIRSERLGGGAVSFALSNADGSPAEMSGNGARCLGLAAARAGWWEDTGRPLVLRTPVGERRLVADGDGSCGWMVDIGNPHAVALLEGPMPGREELEVVTTADAAPVNYEFVVRGPEVGAVTMVVHERGVGWTQACGTGSVAAAWAAHQQGWVGRLVTVHNPGGSVQVDLSGPEASLIGPAAFVATVEVAPGFGGAGEGGRP